MIRFRLVELRQCTLFEELVCLVASVEMSGVEFHSVLA